MFIFYFLGVGLPCRLIFCQFWLCEEQCVYLSCAAILILKNKNISIIKFMKHDLGFFLFYEES